MLEFAKEDPDLSPRADENMHPIILRNFRQGNYVMLTGMKNLFLWRSDMCDVDLVAVKETLYSFQQAIYLQKNSPYTKLFNKVYVEFSCIFLYLEKIAQSNFVRHRPIA